MPNEKSKAQPAVISHATRRRVQKRAASKVSPRSSSGSRVRWATPQKARSATPARPGNTENPINISQKLRSPAAVLAAAEGGDREPNHQRTADGAHGENQVGLIDDESFVADQSGPVGLVEDARRDGIVESAGGQRIEDIS